MEAPNFGRDKDLKALLKTLQPKPFKGEGGDVARDLEEWIITMEEYFKLAKYNLVAQGIMGREILEGSTKTWWKMKCQSKGVFEITQEWDELKLRLKKRYFPLNYATSKMNEFLSCVRKGRVVDTYYE